MGGLVDWLLGLSGWPVYAAVGLLAFGEAAGFLGLVVPGELAVVLGGVVTSAGGASWRTMVVVVAVCAIAGDSVGYEIGRRFGPRLVAWPPFARRFGRHVERTETYLRERGGRAVFLGRWTSVLRALIPAAAGMSRMHYGRFLVFNVAGGVAWSITFVTAGYLAGASWQRVERVAGQASLVVLLVLVLGVLVRLAAKRLSAHEAAVRARLGRLAAWRPVAAVRRRFANQLAWLGARLTPGATRGLGWTLSAIVVAGAAWVLGGVAQDLLARDELALLDAPVAGWFAGVRTPSAVAVADAIVRAFGPPWGWWMVVVAVPIAWRLRSRSAALVLLVAAASTTAVVAGLHAVLPPVAGTRFPAAATAFTAAVAAALVPVFAMRGWRVAVRTVAVGTMACALVSVAELLAGGAALSGVVAGAALGVLLAILADFVARTVASTEPQAPAQVR